ncbi:MAG: hypothetical protein H7Z43_12810 [Clostridia bacterium]|nr:hypothetical protein [Deltaproteobacteria bacterium]
MRALGELDDGKYGVDEPFFAYLLRALKLDDEASLAFLLTSMLAAMLSTAEDLAGIARNLAARFADTDTTQLAEPTWTTARGEARYGISSNVPCYGINGVTKPWGIEQTWRRLHTGLERWPSQRDAMLELFAPELSFYYGASARGSGALSVMW